MAERSVILMKAVAFGPIVTTVMASVAVIAFVHRGYWTAVLAVAYPLLVAQLIGSAVFWPQIRRWQTQGDPGGVIIASALHIVLFVLTAALHMSLIEFFWAR